MNSPYADQSKGITETSLLSLDNWIGNQSNEDSKQFVEKYNELKEKSGKSKKFMSKKPNLKLSTIIQGQSANKNAESCDELDEDVATIKNIDTMKLSQKEYNRNDLESLSNIISQQKPQPVKFKTTPDEIIASPHCGSLETDHSKLIDPMNPFGCQRKNFSNTVIPGRIVSFISPSNSTRPDLLIPNILQMKTSPKNINMNQERGSIENHEEDYYSIKPVHNKTPSDASVHRKIKASINSTANESIELNESILSDMKTKKCKIRLI